MTLIHSQCRRVTEGGPVGTRASVLKSPCTAWPANRKLLADPIRGVGGINYAAQKLICGREFFAQPEAPYGHPTGEAEANGERAGLPECAVLNGFSASAAPAPSSAVPCPFGPANPTRRVVACKL